jgi:hypothetical protein
MDLGELGNGRAIIGHYRDKLEGSTAARQALEQEQARKEEDKRREAALREPADLLRELLHRRFYAKGMGRRGHTREIGREYMFSERFALKPSQANDDLPALKLALIARGSYVKRGVLPNFSDTLAADAVVNGCSLFLAIKEGEHEELPIKLGRIYSTFGEDGYPSDLSVRKTVDGLRMATREAALLAGITVLPMISLAE